MTPGPVRTLIAEDEPHARALLRSMLATDDRIAVVAEAADGRSAVEAIRKHRPDLLFLDIRMPELDGFEVLLELGEAPFPAVIFVTAFDEYALRAFDVHAVDYLIKPFDAARLARAVTHALSRITTPQSGDLEGRMMELLEALRAVRGKPIERIPIKTDGRVRFVNVGDIDWIEADNHVLRIHVGKDVHVLRESMGSMESRLDPGRFTRLHRGIIANLSRIREVQPWFEGDYIVILNDGTKLTTGSMYRKNVKRLLDLPE